jgi:hypothetical protein
MTKDTDRALAHARSIQEKMTKRLDGRGSADRSVVTGRYVSNAAAARHPRTTIREGVTRSGRRDSDE